MGTVDPIVSDWRDRLTERAALANQATGLGAWEWRLDDGLFTCDARTRALFDLDESGPVNIAALTRRLPVRERARFAAELDDAARGGVALDAEVIVQAGDERRWIRCAANLVRDAADRPLRLVGASWDNSAAQRLSEAVHDGQERLQITLGAIDDGVITTSVAGLVTFLNTAAEGLTGWTSAAAAGRAIGDVLRFDALSDGESRDLARACLRDNVTRRRSAARVVGRDGVTREIELTASPMRTREDAVVGAILVLHDVTEQRALERRLQHAARHDALTGLPNRMQVEDALGAALRVARAGPAGALCYLDIDQFKMINDTAGHVAGDEFLRQMAALFEAHAATGDLLARLGGDEFAWVMSDVDLNAAAARAQRLVQATAAFRFHWGDRVFNAAVSAGLCAVEAGLTPAELLSQADVACYSAKAEGRSRISVYRGDDETAAARHREIGMAARLREVIRQGRLTLHAQQIAAAANDGDAGAYVEVLVRMIGEDGQLVPPGAFIPAAERFDLMGEIDRWVIEEALLRRGHELAVIPNLRLALNLSGNSLNDPALLDRILEVVAQSPIPATRLTFEITETSALNNLRAAGGFMRRLRDAGCRIALDDFGVGLSSFAYLKTFPIDCVKIDGSFIRNIATDATDRAIVDSMNALAHRLGAQTVAEFVEDEPTISVLRELGVDYLQGYAIGRPAPLAEVLARHARPLGSFAAE